MSYKKIIDAATDAFRQTFSEFCQNDQDGEGSQLSPEAMAKLTKGLLAASKSAGQAGLGTYLAQHNTNASSVCINGIKYRYKNLMEKWYLTLFGEVSVMRSIYSNDLIGGYVVPMDRALGISCDEYATLETRDMILFAATFNTPEEVATLLSKASLCQPSRTAIQHIISKDGVAIEQNREVIAENVREKQTLPADAMVLAASMDGTNVRLRDPGVKKGRKTQRPGDQKIDDDSACSSFKNAMVASISWYNRDAENRPQRIVSTYLARMPQEKAIVFKSDFENTLSDYIKQANSENRIIEKILLCDGARGIWNYAKQNELFTDFKWCVDFFHTTEHLSKAAEAIFGKSSAKGQKWYQEWKEALRTDSSAPNSIIRSISSYMERLKLTKSSKKALLAELTFFKNNKHLMVYAEFNKKGYPIGSGPVEAAGKTIVKQRMCRSGMRWNVASGQHILSLRTFAKSNQWEAMWNSYVNLKLAA